MLIQSTTIDETIIVTVQGELDGKTAPQAQQEIVPLIPEGGHVVLDMHGVGYMSSAGLRMMLLLYRHALGKNTKIALVGLSEDIRDTMSATGFLDFFVVSDTVESGVSLLREGE
ncbi:anti-sigma factor antagonist [soil metagenome]